MDMYTNKKYSVFGALSPGYTSFFLEVEAMAYRFTERKSFKQQQNTYALYMILSSYFNRSICSNKLQDLFAYADKVTHEIMDKMGN